MLDTRTQKVYSLSFKLAAVKEVESGFTTQSHAMHKYGIEGNATNVPPLNSDTYKT